MKKYFFYLALLPLILCAQNITNTLGTSGTFIVEDNANKSIIQAKRPSPGTTRIIFGDYTNSFNLPTGNIDFVHNDGTERVNIVVGKSGNFSAFPKLQLYYTPGSLVAPLSVVNQNTLGIINFGGWLDGQGGWREDAFISVDVQGAPSLSIPTKMNFATRDASGSSFKVMSFDNTGNLTIPGVAGTGTVPLQADANGKLIRSSTLTGVSVSTISTGINAIAPLTDAAKTYTLLPTDQTILVTTTSTTTGNPDFFIILPATSSVPVGKTYTIKKLPRGAGNWRLSLLAPNSKTIDGVISVTSTPSGGISIGAANLYPYITVQSDGTNWFIIAKGTAQ